MDISNPRLPGNRWALSRADLPRLAFMACRIRLGKYKKIHPLWVTEPLEKKMRR